MFEKIQHDGTPGFQFESLINESRKACTLWHVQLRLALCTTFQSPSIPQMGNVPNGKSRANPAFSTPLTWRLLLDVHAVEAVAAKRAEFKVDHFLAHRFELYRMGDGEPGGLFLEDHLRLHVKLGAFRWIAHHLGFLDQVFKWFVAPFCYIAAIGFGGVATQQVVEKVVGVAVVAGPSQHAHLVFPSLHALAVLAPLK